MERRNFIKHAGVFTSSFFITKGLMAKNEGPVYGHGRMRYRMDTKWSKANPMVNPVNDCHEMVQDQLGRIILLTNETRNNILIYDTSGKLVDTWGHEFPGGHGLTLVNENGTDFLFITDTLKHQVFKTTIDGKILLTLDYPKEANVYKKPEEFIPTEVAVDTNGDFYIADGYGAQYITKYDKFGNLIGCFGGRGEGDEHFDNAHGIVIDRRQKDPTLLITDRTRNCFKRFTLDGNLIEVIKLPGACVCRPVIKDKHLYAAVLMSPNLAKPGTGFVTILDKENKVVSNIGGTKPEYINEELQPMSQAEKIFTHPHDVCIDSDENLYVAQWASGKVYPYKFTRV